MLEYQGRQYARVSEILAPFSDFGHIDPKVLAKKAALGTHVHQAIHDYITLEFPVLNEKEMGYFESFKRWVDAVKPYFVETERRLYDEDKRITGCIDALITLPGSKDLILVDYKTSVQESPIVWPMQAHLYSHLISYQDNPYWESRLTGRFLFVKLDKGGKNPTVYEYAWERNTHIKCMNAIDEFWKTHTK
jgi:hypothetical protein